MARLMSVAFTEQAVIERRKTVTRRKGWWENKTGRRLLVPGDRLTLCRKVMGRKKGEPLVRLADVEVVDVRRERLGEMLTHFALDQEPGYGEAEVALEGFPAMDPVEFVQRFFVVAQGISPADEVTRIEWRYLDKGSEDCARGSVPSAPIQGDDVTWTMPRASALALLGWLRHNRPIGMPDEVFAGLMDALSTPGQTAPPASLSAQTEEDGRG